jgi:hypothetical protein
MLICEQTEVLVILFYVLVTFEGKLWVNNVSIPPTKYIASDILVIYIVYLYRLYFDILWPWYSACVLPYRLVGRYQYIGCNLLIPSSRVKDFFLGLTLHQHQEDPEDDSLYNLYHEGLQTYIHHHIVSTVKIWITCVAESLKSPLCLLLKHSSIYYMWLKMYCYCDIGWRLLQIAVVFAYHFG